MKNKYKKLVMKIKHKAFESYANKLKNAKTSEQK